MKNLFAVLALVVLVLSGCMSDNNRSISETVERHDKILSSGIVFHFRSDSAICDDQHINHYAALNAAYANGIDAGHVVCDEFVTSK